MKKNWTKSLLLASVLALLAACGPTSAPTEAPSGSPTEAPTSAPTEAPTSAPVVTPGFDVEAAFSMNIGETHQISITNVVEIASFSYTSYDDTVATVDDNGLVTAVGEGKTSILIRGDDIRKTVDVEVINPNKLNGLIPFEKLASIAGLTADESSIDYTGAPIINYGWDVISGLSHGESTAAKFDFDNVKDNTEKVGRGAAVENAYVYNGDYVVVMRANADECEGDVHATTYHKTDVSQWANSFRLWGWSTVNDEEEAPLSGAGKFRVMVYEPKNDQYTDFTSYPLTILDANLLTQDEEGWIEYDEVSNAIEGTIAGAPDYNMFVYAVSQEGVYDLRGKEGVIITVEFAATGAVEGKNDCFGIKRMGFMCNEKPTITLASDAEVELFANNTHQINVTAVGDATQGTFTYTSSNEAVATVSDTGLVTAADVAEEGSATITISNDKAINGPLEVKVNVKPTPATSFDVPEEIIITKGSTQQIEITNQVSCEAGFTYETNFNGIATVDEDGLITAVDAGNTTVKVTCGELYKYINVSVNTSSMYNLTADQAKNMPAVPAASTTVPAEWDFTWSGKTVADNVVLENDDYTSSKLHLSISEGASALFENNNDCLGMISGIGGTRTNSHQMSLYTKVEVPTGTQPFRLWAKTPTETPDMLDKAQVRIVIYVPNEDYTSFTAYTLAYDGYCDYAAAEISNSAENIVTYKILEDGHFFTFSTPEAARGKTGFLAIETYSIANEGNAQTRAYVRRFGWC